jgi:hypothetical protein
MHPSNDELNCLSMLRNYLCQHTVGLILSQKMNIFMKKNNTQYLNMTNMNDMRDLTIDTIRCICRKLNCSKVLLMNPQTFSHLKPSSLSFSILSANELSFMLTRKVTLKLRNAALLILSLNSKTTINVLITNVLATSTNQSKKNSSFFFAFPPSGVQTLG